jgi:hypothetical protein
MAPTEVVARAGWRPATTMMLYVSIVLLAEVAAFPDDLRRLETLAIVWGTTIGLALAHWFAFEFSAVRLHRSERGEVWSELGGAALVALITTVPIIVFPPAVHRQVVPFVIAVVIGFVSYAVERTNGRSRRRSLAFAGIVLLAGLAVAGVKDLISYH